MDIMVDTPAVVALRPETLAEVGAPVPTWRLTQDIYMLRLTVADASLRAREDAGRYTRDAQEYWSALGRAHGYQKATALLRGWTHPDAHLSVLDALAGQAELAATRAAAVAPDVEHPANARAYCGAYAWAISWALAQARELCARAATSA